MLIKEALKGSLCVVSLEPDQGILAQQLRARVGWDEMEGSGSSGPAHASSTVSDVCEMEEIVASDGLGADSQACAEMRAPGSESALGKRGIDEVDMAGMLLTPLQQQVLQRIVDELDTKSTSVVVTNPLRKGAPEGALPLALLPVHASAHARMRHVRSC